MAPTRKRSVNKRFLSEVSPEKEVRNLIKNKQEVTGKRKHSDKLGPRWSNKELKKFYKAYREYGKKWKKVAAEVGRTAEMVEALYEMNKAYLSLPEGTASVLGFIAMLSDHYTVLDANDSDGESNDVPKMTKKSLKRKRGNVQLNASKDDILLSHPNASNGGCLSLLKRGHFDGNQPRAVGKRTPRFPVSFTYKKDDGESYVSPKKKGRKSDVATNDDEGAHVAALALTQASQRGGSPQVCQTQHRKIEHVKRSPVRSLDRMFSQPESTPTKLCAASIYENWFGSKGARTGVHSKETMDMEGVGTFEIHQKGKKIYGKKVKVEEIGNNESDDGGEACSGTEEGQKPDTLKGKVDIEVSNTKIDESYARSQRRRSKKLFSGDEVSALDALQTLAHISVMESESSIKLNEEITTLVVDDKSSSPEAISTSIHGDKIKLPREKERRHSGSVRGGISSRKSNLARPSEFSPKSVSEAKQQPPSINMLKRKNGYLVSKVSNAEGSIDSHRSKTLENESSDGEGNISVFKNKCTGQISSPSKQLKSTKISEGSFSGKLKSAASDLAIQPVHVASKATFQTRKESRRKMNLKRACVPKEGRSSEKNLKNQANKNSISILEKSLHQKEKLSSCLSSSMFQRWCIFEWFYSAIDYPWFAKREFVEYLNHVGLGHIPRLTRVEWGVIRSSLGKPRRFSERFLHEEREKLRQYRESVRKHYTELRIGVGEGLPTDLARPLSVGQRVIAVHPKTREIHDGSVLTVDHDRCGVQFDRPDIGVEFVKDIDCMPLNPTDNMPEALKRERSFVTSKELQVNGHSNIGGFTSSGHLENAAHPMNTLVKQTQMEAISSIPQSKDTAVDVINFQPLIGSQPYAVSQNQAKDVDMQTLSELNRALDKKEALLMELKNTNNNVLESQNIGDNSLKDSDSFKNHLATVLVQLKEASVQACGFHEASSALLKLQQRNSYLASSLPPWLKAPANSIFPGELPSSYDSCFVGQESGSAVLEILKGSRLKAHTMVDAAVQAISKMEEGDDAFVRIGEALDTVDKRQLATESRIQVIRSTEQANGSMHNHSQSIPSTLEPQANGFASQPKLHSVSDKIDLAIPSDLIASCVATLLMIQTCTERQYPPADVAQIIDSAVTSLHPYSSQNLPIYREIQMCMGRIKNQILALIPT